jgi:hypothetical protein
LPWIAPLLVARLWLGTNVGEERELVARTAERAAPICVADGCGCPHDAVDASCCCAQEERAPAERDVVAAPERSVGARRDGRIGIQSFHCSGGRSGHSALGAVAVLAALPEPDCRLVCEGARAWPVKGEPGPAFDLHTEPATPPPRGPSPRA